MAQIPLAEISWHDLSFADPNGRLFSWQGELHRGIKTERTSFYARLFDEGIIQQLVERKLFVETERTSMSLEGFGMVVKHRRLPFVSYPFEWPAPMLKQAALTVLDLEMALLERGLGLQDCHPWNVLFDATQPLFVDFGSIVPAGGNALWEANGEFFRYYSYPLQVMASGNTRIARWLLHDHHEGISQIEADCLARRPGAGLKEKARDVFRRVGKSLPSGVVGALSRSFNTVDQTVSGRAPRPFESRADYLRRLRMAVENIKFPRLKSEWSGYYDDSFPSFTPSDDWDPKHHSVYKVVSDLKPETLFDIGSNRGWYSMMAARHGVKVIASDVDDQCISQLFFDAAEGRLSVHPIILDIRDPSPGAGLCNQELAPATQRLKCEMVMALALVHHMVFKFHMNFDQFVRCVSELTTKDLLVEFVPREDRYVKEWWTPAKSWYTLEGFKESLLHYYSSVTLLPSHPEPRVLLLCRQ